ncbi:MAG: hypothetical protein RLZZ522_2171 [Verrucomicrobiota bacterium]
MDPTTPPPDLPAYTPPPPTIAAAPVITAPDVPTPEQARRINLKVAKEVVDEATLDGALAPFNARMMAAGIDLLLAIGLGVTVELLLPDWCPAWLLGGIVGLAYWVTRDSLPFLGGQSVGKKVQGLKALTVDGESLAGNWKAGLIRSGPLLVLPFTLIEIYVLLTREDTPARGRRLGDEWSQTKVVIHRRTPPAPAAA